MRGSTGKDSGRARSYHPLFNMTPLAVQTIILLENSQEGSGRPNKGGKEEEMLEEQTLGNSWKRCERRTARRDVRGEQLENSQRDDSGSKPINLG